MKKKGGKSHLLMFLSGKGGSGKSYVISVAQRYCHTFCQYASIPYDDTSIYFTAMTGCAAVLLKGLTLHSATNFESTTKTRISDEERYKWMHVIILVIDETSFMSISQLTKLDRMLRRLRCEPDRPYGGINIVFIGDFHQLLPFGGAKEALYNNYSIHWHQWINTAVFLINDHRFSEDRAYGKLVERVSNGTVTKEDIDLINTRLLNDGCGNGGNLELPEDTSDICYACGKNDERNSITTSMFRNLVEETHPIADNDDCILQIPKNTVIFDRNDEQCKR